MGARGVPSEGGVPPADYSGKSLSRAAAAVLGSSRNQHVFVLLLLPILLWSLNDTTIFSKPVDLDQFVYAGFHLHLPQYLNRFGFTYYATRIPWIALGYAAHRLFDIEHAIYVEHILVFYLAVFSLYASVTIIFANRQAAFAAAMFLGTHAWFLLGAGWDYVDGAYVGCLALSLATLGGAAFGRRWRLAAIMWGAAVALSITLYILWVILVPIEIALFLGFNRLGQRHKVHVIAALGLCGAIAAMVCMGCISWLAGGKLLYLLPQITILNSVAANRFNYDIPLYHWLRQAVYLLAPGAVWLFSLLWAAQNGRAALRKLRSPDSEGDVNGRLWLACVCCVVGFLLFLGFELADFHLLYFADKTRALLPFELLVVGGTLALGRRESFQRYEYAYTLTIILVTLGPWVASGFNLITPHPQYFAGLTAMACWIVGGALILWVRPVSTKLKYLIVALFFSATGFGPANIVWMTFPPDPHYKEERLAIFEASQEIWPYNKNLKARFWYSDKDPLIEVLRGVASIYLYEYSLVNENFPNLTSSYGTVSSIASGDRIIFLTSGGDPLPAANRAVADKHLIFHVVASKQFRREGNSFTFIVADVVPALNIGPAGALREVRCRSSNENLLVNKIPLGSLRPLRSGKVSMHDGGVTLITPRNLWENGATIPLSLADHTVGPGVLCVRLQVTKGRLGVGIFAHDKLPQMLFERPVEVTNSPTELEFVFADIAKAARIIFRSWSQGGAEAHIDSIAILRQRAPTPAQH
jgi:hypothetical protein